MLECFAICDMGLVRQSNQDNIYINGIYREDVSDNSLFVFHDTTSSCGMYAVADGMGGEQHGELASLIAVQTLRTINFADRHNSLMQYLTGKNDEICNLASGKGNIRIGTTFTGLCINGQNVDVVNIGDSRAYLLRDDDLMQLSRDHTSVQQMVDFGVITREAARSHSRRHVLTQHLGISPDEMIIEPFAQNFTLWENDLFLLCSDGLTDMVDDAKIKSILKMQGAVRFKAQELYIEAIQNGGKDNISILLVHVK